MSGPFVVNARMYSVAPEAEAAWRTLLGHVLDEAGLGGLAGGWTYLPYPAPQPLEDLWTRPDLGCAFMCGYPVALGLADVTPIAAPIPAASWAEGMPVYRTDLIVRADAPFRSLEDTFGARLGWTVEHSQSGFNALRHHLLAYRTPDRPILYGEVTGRLVTARAVLGAVAAGRIDVGPLDAWWHILLRRHRPDLASQVRVVESTASAPAPPFVAGPAVPRDIVDRLQKTFVAAASRPWFADLAAPLALQGFAPAARRDYAVTLERAQAAEDASYPLPA